MSGTRRTRRTGRSASSRAMLPMSASPKYDHQQQNSPSPSKRSSRRRRYQQKQSSSSGSDEEDKYNNNSESFNDSADFRLDRIPTSTRNQTPMHLETGMGKTPAMSRSQSYHGERTSSSNRSNRSTSRSNSNYYRSSPDTNGEYYYSPSSIPSTTRKRLGHGKHSPSRTENQSDSSSPSHSAMNAAFHSALVGRVTRTHQGGKNMGARAMSKIFRKHLMKERWNKWHLHVRQLRFSIHVELRTLTELWRAWKLFTRNCIQKNVLLKRLIKRHERTCLKEGIRHWTDGCKDRQIMILRHQIAILRPKIVQQMTQEKGRVVRRVIGRLISNLLHQSFKTWHQHHTTMLHYEHVIRTVTARISMRRESNAFNAWFSHVHELWRQRDVIHHALIRIKYKMLTKTFHTWKLQYTTIKRFQTKISRFLTRKNRSSTITSVRHGFRTLMDHYITSAMNEMELEQDRIVAKRLVNLMKKRILQLGFSTWLVTTTEINRFILKKKRAIQKWYSKCLYSTFNQWKFKIVAKNKCKNRINVIAARWKLKQLYYSLLKWKTNVNEIIRIEKRKISILKRVLNRILDKSFASWYECIHETKRIKTLLSRCHSRLLHRTLTKCLNRWYSFSAQRIATRTLLLRLINKSNHKSKQNMLRTKFQLWITTINKIKFNLKTKKEKVEELKKKTLIVKKCMARMTRTFLLSSYNTWKKYFLVVKEQEQKQHRAAMKWYHILLQRSFSSWSINVNEKKKIQNILQKVISKIKNKRLNCCMNVWFELVQTRQVLRHRMIVTAQQWERRNVMVGFRTWSLNVLHIDTEHAILNTNLQMQQLKIDRRNHQLKYILNKKIKNCKYDNFRKWQKIILNEIIKEKEEKKRKLITTRVILRVTKRTLYRCFNTWLNRVQQDLQLKVLLHRLISKKIHNEERTTLNHGFHQWLYISNQLLFHFLQQQTLAKEKERKRNIVNKIILRIQNKKIFMVLSSWKEKTIHSKRIEQLSNNAAKRWINRYLHRSMLMWKMEVRRSITEKSALKRVHSRWMLSIQSKSFQKWFFFISKRKASRLLILKILNSKTYKSNSIGCRQAVRVWCKHVDALKLNDMDVEMREMILNGRKRRMKLCLLHAKKRKTALGFSTWYTFSQNDQKYKNKLKRSVHKWIHLNKTRCFQTWHHQIQWILRERQLLKRAVCKITQRKLTCMFAHWCTTTKEKIEQKNRMKRIISRFKYLNLSVGFRELYNYSKYVLDQESSINYQISDEINAERKQLRTIILKRTVSKIVRRDVATAYHTWKMECLKGRKRMVTKQKALSRFFHRLLYKSFTSWNVNIQAMLSNRTILKRAVLKCQHRTLSKCLQRWSIIVTDKIWLRSLITHVLDNKMKTTQLQLFLKWKKFIYFDSLSVLEKEKKQIFVKSFVRKMKSTLLLRGWKCWTLHVLKEQEREMNIRRAASLWHNATLHCTFNKWKLIIDEQIEVRVLLKRVGNKMLKRNLSKCFETWWYTTSQNLHLKNKMKVFIYNWKYNNITCSFQKWKNVNQFMKEKKYVKALNDAQRLTVRQKEYYEETKRHAQLKVCVVYYRIRWMRAALHVWKSDHLRSQKIQHLRRKSIRLLSKRLEKFAFDLWRRKILYLIKERVKETTLSLDIGVLQHQHTIMKSILNRMRHRLTCHMFQQWKSQFINNRRMKSFLHRYKHTVVYKCWTKWLNVLFISKERKEKKSQRKKHLYRFTLNKMVSTTTSSLHVAWNSFKFHTMQSKHQEEMDDARLQRMRGVLFRLSTRSLHSSFNQWYSCVVVQKKVKRIMVRLSKNVVHRAWNSWSAFVALRMHNRTVVSRFLSKIMHHQLRKGINKWKHYIVGVKQNIQIQKIKNRSILLVVQRMRSICKSNAFHAWCEMLETKRKLRSIGKRMMNTQLAGAITGWKSFVSEKVATRQLMVKVMNRMHKTLLNSGFRSWLDYSRMVVDREFREGIRNRRMLLVVQRMKFLRVSKTFTTWKMLRKTMKSCRLLLVRLHRRKVLSCLYTWLSYVQDRQRVITLLRAAVCRKHTCDLVHAFKCWLKYDLLERLSRLELCNVDAMQKQILLQQRKLLKRVITKGLLYRGIKHAFETWKERMLNRIAVKRAVQKMMKRVLHRSWNTWKAVARENRISKQLLLRAISKMNNNKLCFSFQNWKMNVKNKILKKKRIKIVLQRLVNTNYTLALNTWKKYNQYLQQLQLKQFAINNKKLNDDNQLQLDEKRKRSRLHKLFIRIKLITLLKSFNQWYDHIREQIYHRTVIQRVATKMKARNVSKCFNTWIYIVKATKRNERLLKRALYKMRKKKILSSFDTWYIHVQQHKTRIKEQQEQMEQKRKAAYARHSQLQHFILRLSRTRLYSFYNTWSWYTKEKKRKKNVLKRAVIKLKQKTMFSSLNTWIFQTNAAKCARNLFKKILFKWKRNMIYSGFTTWRSNCNISLTEYERAIAKNQTARLKNVIHRMTRSVVLHCFTTWNNTRKNNKILQNITKRVIHKMKKSKLLFNFNVWYQFHSDRQLCRTILLRMNSRQTKDLTRQRYMTSFRKWLSHTDYSRCMDSGIETQEAIEKYDRLKKEKDRKIITRFVSSMRSHVLHKGIVTWKKQMTAMVQKENQMKQAVKHWLTLNLRKIFLKWLSYMKENSKMKNILKRCILKIKNTKMTNVMKTWMEYVDHRRTLRSFITLRMIAGNKGGLRKSWRSWILHVKDINHQQILNERVIQLEKHRVLLVNAALEDRKKTTLELENISMKSKQFEKETILLKQSITELTESYKQETIKVSSQNRRGMAMRTIKMMAHSRRSKKYRLMKNHFIEWRYRSLQQKQFKAKNQYLIERDQLWLDKQSLEMKMTNRRNQTIQKCTASLLYKIKNKLVANAYNTWNDKIKQSKRYRHVVYKYRNKLMKKKEMKFFNAWWCNVVQVRKERVLIQKCRARMMHHTLYSNFCTWYTTVQHNKIEKVKEIKYQLNQIKKEEEEEKEKELLEQEQEKIKLKKIIERKEKQHQNETDIKQIVDKVITTVILNYNQNQVLQYKQDLQNNENTYKNSLTTLKQKHALSTLRNEKSIVITSFLRKKKDKKKEKNQKRLIYNEWISNMKKEKEKAIVNMDNMQDEHYISTKQVLMEVAQDHKRILAMRTIKMMKHAKAHKIRHCCRRIFHNWRHLIVHTKATKSDQRHQDKLRIEMELNEEKNVSQKKTILEKEMQLQTNQTTINDLLMSLTRKDGNHKRVLAMRTIKMMKHSTLHKNRHVLRRCLHCWRNWKSKELHARLLVQHEQSNVNLQNIHSLSLEKLKSEHNIVTEKYNNDLLQAEKNTVLAADQIHVVQQEKRDMEQEMKSNHQRAMSLRTIKLMTHSKTMKRYKKLKTYFLKWHIEHLKFQKWTKNQVLLSKTNRVKVIEIEKNVMLEERKELSDKHLIHISDIEKEHARTLAMRTIKMMKHSTSHKTRHILRRCLHCWRNWKSKEINTRQLIQKENEIFEYNNEAQLQLQSFNKEIQSNNQKYISSMNTRTMKLLKHSNTHKEKLLLRTIFSSWILTIKREHQMLQIVEKQNYNLESLQRIEFHDQKIMSTQQEHKRVLAMRTIKMMKHSTSHKNRHILRRCLHCWRNWKSKVLHARLLVQHEEKSSTTIYAQQNTIENYLIDFEILKKEKKEREKKLNTLTLQQNEMNQNYLKLKETLTLSEETSNALKIKVQQHQEDIQVLHNEKKNISHTLSTTEVILQKKNLLHATSVNDLKTLKQLQNTTSIHLSSTKNALKTSKLLQMKTLKDVDNQKLQLLATTQEHTRTLALRTIRMSKHAALRRSRRYLSTALNIWWMNTIRNTRAKTSSQHVFEISKFKKSAKISNQKLETVQDHMSKFQESLLRATKHKGKAALAISSPQKAKHRRGQSTMEFETTMAHKFEEAESYYVAGKLLKDHQLIEIASNILNKIDTQMIDRNNKTNKTKKTKKMNLDKNLENKEIESAINETAAVEDVATKLLHGRVVSWRSMTESALNRHESAVKEGERAADMFKQINDVLREFSTCDNMFISEMKLYIDTENKTKKKEIATTSLKRCQRMQLLISKQTKEKKKQNPSFPSKQQTTQLIWRIKHLTRLIEETEDVFYLETSSQLIFKPKINFSSSLFDNRRGSVEPDSISSQQQKETTTSNKAKSKSMPSQKSSLKPQNHRNSHVVTSLFSAPISEKHIKRRTNSGNNIKKLTRRSSSMSISRTIKYNKNVSRDIRSAAAAVLFVFGRTNSRNRVELIDLLTKGDYINHLATLPNGDIILKSLYSSANSNMENIDKKYFVHLLQQAVDGDQTNLSLLRPKSMPSSGLLPLTDESMSLQRSSLSSTSSVSNSKSKRSRGGSHSHSRRPSVMALQGMKVTSHRISGLTGEALHKATSDQEDDTFSTIRNSEMIDSRNNSIVETVEEEEEEEEEKEEKQKEKQKKEKEKTFNIGDSDTLSITATPTPISPTTTPPVSFSKSTTPVRRSSLRTGLTMKHHSKAATTVAPSPMLKQASSPILKNTSKEIAVEENKVASNRSTEIVGVVSSTTLHKSKSVRRSSLRTGLTMKHHSKKKVQPPPPTEAINARQKKNESSASGARRNSLFNEDDALDVVEDDEHEDSVHL